MVSCIRILCRGDSTGCWAGCCEIERKNITIMTEIKEHRPSIICSCEGLETEWWLCWFCLLKFKIHPVRGKHAEVACENFCLAPILWTGKFWTPIFLSARRADQNVRGLVLNRSNNSCGRLNHWMEVSCFFMPEEKISNFQLCSIACPHWLTPDCHQWDQDLDCARPWSSVTWHTMPIDMVEPFFRITEGFPKPKYSQQWCTA